LDAAHFAIVERPGSALDAAIAWTPTIAARIAAGAHALPDPPATAVVRIEVHTRDVSSTTIRSRLAAHHAIDDLVPAAVTRYITAHHLYGAVDDLHGENHTGSKARS
jgi:nicotinic acid mononucleotide adenylyltransferase